MDASVVDRNVDVEVAQNRQLSTFLDQDFGPLAFGVALLHQVEDWCNVPISRSHQKIPYFLNKLFIIIYKFKDVLIY